MAKEEREKAAHILESPSQDGDYQHVGAYDDHYKQAMLQQMIASDIMPETLSQVGTNGIPSGYDTKNFFNTQNETLGSPRGPKQNPKLLYQAPKPVASYPLPNGEFSTKVNFNQFIRVDKSHDREDQGKGFHHRQIRIA
jgi:hypothetical protein